MGQTAADTARAECHTTVADFLSQPNEPGSAQPVVLKYQIPSTPPGSEVQLHLKFVVPKGDPRAQVLVFVKENGKRGAKTYKLFDDVPGGRQRTGEVLESTVSVELPKRTACEVTIGWYADAQDSWEDAVANFLDHQDRGTPLCAPLPVAFQMRAVGALATRLEAFVGVDFPNAEAVRTLDGVGPTSVEETALREVESGNTALYFEDERKLVVKKGHLHPYLHGDAVSLRPRVVCFARPKHEIVANFDARGDVVHRRRYNSVDHALAAVSRLLDDDADAFAVLDRSKNMVTVMRGAMRLHPSAAQSGADAMVERASLGFFSRALKPAPQLPGTPAEVLRELKSRSEEELRAMRDPDTGETALHAVVGASGLRLVAKEQAEAVARLLECGLSVADETRLERTALDVAIGVGAPGEVVWLLESCSPAHFQRKEEAALAWLERRAPEGGENEGKKKKGATQRQPHHHRHQGGDLPQPTTSEFADHIRATHKSLDALRAEGAGGADKLYVFQRLLDLKLSDAWMKAYVVSKGLAKNPEGSANKIAKLFKLAGQCIPVPFASLVVDVLVETGLAAKRRADGRRFEAVVSGIGDNREEGSMMIELLSHNFTCRHQFHILGMAQGSLELFAEKATAKMVIFMTQAASVNGPSSMAANIAFMGVRLVSAFVGGKVEAAKVFLGDGVDRLGQALRVPEPLVGAVKAEALEQGRGLADKATDALAQHLNIAAGIVAGTAICEADKGGWFAKLGEVVGNALEAVDRVRGAFVLRNTALAMTDKHGGEVRVRVEVLFASAPLVVETGPGRGNVFSPGAEAKPLAHKARAQADSLAFFGVLAVGDEVAAQGNVEPTVRDHPIPPLRVRYLSAEDLANEGGRHAAAASLQRQRQIEADLEALRAHVARLHDLVLEQSNQITGLTNKNAEQDIQIAGLVNRNAELSERNVELGDEVAGLTHKVAEQSNGIAELAFKNAELSLLVREVRKRGNADNDEAQVVGQAAKRSGGSRVCGEQAPTTGVADEADQEEAPPPKKRTGLFGFAYK